MWGKEWEKKRNSHPQLVIEGAETLQAKGRVKAFETFKTTPKWELLLKAPQRQDGAVLTSIFRPEQHDPSGWVRVLPFVRNEKQSVMARTSFEHSPEGDDEAPLVKSRAHMPKMMHRMSENFDAIGSDR